MNSYSVVLDWLYNIIIIILELKYQIREKYQMQKNNSDHTYLIKNSYI